MGRVSGDLKDGVIGTPLLMEAGKTARPVENGEAAVGNRFAHGVVERNDEIEVAPQGRDPAMGRAVLEQQHPRQQPPRPFLAVRPPPFPRASGRAASLQAQLQATTCSDTTEGLESNIGRTMAGYRAVFMASLVPELHQAQIIRRRVNIAFDASKAQGWYFKKKLVEDFLNAVSFTFPQGEKFFIHSVQNYRDKITDAVLQEQVKQFIYQEAMHTKEHARCNETLMQAFPHGQIIDRYTTKVISFWRRFSPRATQLACTCALEHFTAILADTLLRNQEAFIAASDPAFASLWLWHAVEEAEHKAVCFDVYRAVVGKGVLSYLHRVSIMFLTSVCFLFSVFVAITLIRRKKKQEENRSPGVPKAKPSPRKPSGEPGMLKGLLHVLPLRLYLDYYRPAFHPWDHDNLHLIEEWKRRYRDFGIPSAQDHTIESATPVT